MKFEIYKMSAYGFYTIAIEDEYDEYIDNDHIAEKIGITKEQYQQELNQFNNISYDNKIMFNNRDDAKKALNHLNEKYGIVLKFLD
jgi:hypothetical protein